MRELVLVVGEEGALGARLLVVHFVHVRGEALGARRLVLAQRAREWLQVCVQVPLQAPVVYARPRAVATRVATFALLLQKGRHVLLLTAIIYNMLFVAYRITINNI